jgi:hypothetical protein
MLRRTGTLLQKGAKRSLANKVRGPMGAIGRRAKRIVSLVIAAIAVVGVFTPIPYISTLGFWIAILAYVVLAVGNLSKT